MIDTKITDDELKELLVRPKFGAQFHYIASCPYCNKDGHFYVNRKTYLWDCKKCNEEGNLFKLLAHLGKLFMLGEFKSIDIRRIDAKLGKEELEDEVIDKGFVPNKLLPVGFKRKYEDEYLTKRGLTESNLKKYRIGYTSLLSSLKDYVIFSVDEDGHCKGYVARYTKPIKDKEKLRYNNSRHTNFSRLLFGYDDMVEGTHTAIMVEGIFDKISLDNYLNLDDAPYVKSVCTFGKKISETQVLKLKAKGIKNVILIFDYDAIKEMKKYSRELKQHFDNVLIGYTTNKDINDSTQREVLSIFDNLRTVEQFDKKVLRVLR